MSISLFSLFLFCRSDPALCFWETFHCLVSHVSVALSPAALQIPEAFFSDLSFFLKFRPNIFSLSLIDFWETLKDGFFKRFRLSAILSRHWLVSWLPASYFYYSNNIISLPIITSCSSSEKFCNWKGYIHQMYQSPKSILKRGKMVQRNGHNKPQSRNWRRLANILLAVVAGHEMTLNLFHMRSGAFRCADAVVVKEVFDS